MDGSMGDPAIEKFKKQVDIVQLVEKYFPLKRKGGANFWATCPFHDEKTASFSVNPQRQIFYCFGCHQKGDVLDFVQDYLKVEFPEALQIISRDFNLPLPEFQGSNKFRVKLSHKKGLEETLSAAELVFAGFLWQSEEGLSARKYLETRGFSPETIDTRHIGYAPKSWDLLLNKMRSKGYSIEQQLEAGLLVKNQTRDDHYYDRFRERIIFPIRDANGRIIGFAGRSLEENIEKGMKYINTPETALFSKRKNLYGLYDARQSREKTAVVVEGYTDVLMCQQYGLTNTVAVCGTALTQEHAALLARHFENAVVCFDPDKAGEREAPKAAMLLMHAGLNVRVMLLPGDDIDKVLVKEGVDSVRKRISDAGTLYEFELGKILRKQDPAMLSPDEKKDVLKEIMPFLSSSNGITQCRLYLQETAKKLGIEYKVALAAFHQYCLPQQWIRVSVFESQQSELEALAIMLRTDYSTLFKQRLSSEHFTNPARRALFNYLCRTERRVLCDLPALASEPSMFDALDIKPNEIISSALQNGDSVSGHELFALLSKLQRHPAPIYPDSVLFRICRAKESRDLLALEQRIYDARDANNPAGALALLQKYSANYALFKGLPESSSGKLQQG